LKKYFWDYVTLLGIAAIIVGFDQWTKFLVRTQIPFGKSWSPWPWLEPYVRLVHWQNTGAAFGMFQGFGMVFTVLAFLVAMAILYYFPRVPRSEWGLRVAMVMQMGGAVGNLIDRLIQGTVTDFISVGTFAVFNVADASISVGTAVLIIAVWISERKQKKQDQANQEQAFISTDDSSGSLNQVDWVPDSENQIEKPPDSLNQVERAPDPPNQVERAPDPPNQVTEQPDSENHTLE
jgi:signal peptidase II